MQFHELPVGCRFISRTGDGRKFRKANENSAIRIDDNDCDMDDEYHSFYSNINVIVLGGSDAAVDRGPSPFVADAGSHWKIEVAQKYENGTIHMFDIILTRQQRYTVTNVINLVSVLRNKFPESDYRVDAFCGDISYVKMDV